MDGRYGILVIIVIVPITVTSTSSTSSTTTTATTGIAYSSTSGITGGGRRVLTQYVSGFLASHDGSFPSFSSSQIGLSWGCRSSPGMARVPKAVVPTPATLPCVGTGVLVIKGVPTPAGGVLLTLVDLRLVLTPGLKLSTNCSKGSS